MGGVVKEEEFDSDREDRGGAMVGNDRVECFDEYAGFGTRKSDCKTFE